MTWQPLPPSGPIRRRLGSYQRERDSELLGRTTIDTAVVLSGIQHEIPATGFAKDPAVDDVLASYPLGFSVQYISSAANWPVSTGWVYTYILNPGTSSWRAWQVVRHKEDKFEEWFRGSTDGVNWDDTFHSPPLGLLGVDTHESDTAITTTTSANIVAVTATPESANRRLRVMVTAMMDVDVSGNVIIGEIVEGSTVKQRMQLQENGGWEHTLTGHYIDTSPPTTSTTWGFRAQMNANTGTVLGNAVYPVTLSVEDIGGSYQHP